MYAAIVPDGIF